MTSAMAGSLKNAASSPIVILTLLYIAYLVSFADRVIFGLLMTPMKETFGFSDSQLGLLAGAAFAVAYGIFSPITGYLTDKYDRRWVMAGAIAFWSVMTMATGLAGSFMVMALSRAGVGVGESALSPLAVSLLGDAYPREKRANAFSIYLSAGAAGKLLALLGGGSLVFALASFSKIELPFIGDIEPWRGVFLSAGLLGLVVAAIVIVVLRAPTKAPEISNAEPAPELVTETTQHFVNNYKLLTFSMFVGLSTITLASYAWSTWNVVFFERAHHWDSHKAAMMLGTTTGISLLIGTLSGGKIISILRKMGFKSAPMLLGCFAGIFFALFASLAVLQTNAYAAIGFMTIAAFAGYMPSIAVYGAMGDVLPAAARGRFSGIQTMTIGILTNSLGPFIIGALNDGVFSGDDGIRYSLLATFVVAVTSGVLMVMIGLPQYRRRLTEVAAFEQTQTV